MCVGGLGRGSRNGFLLRALFCVANGLKLLLLRYQFMTNGKTFLRSDGPVVVKPHEERLTVCIKTVKNGNQLEGCLLYTSPSPRDS